MLFSVVGGETGMMRVQLREQVALIGYVLKWFVLSLVLGLIVGSACALFLWLLELVTNIRFSNPSLLWFLPIGGAVVGILYETFGRTVETGNNLIVDEIHEPGGGVPLRMAPLVLLGTILTHLFGGSAGREGTAVQMGGSLASGLAKLIPGLNRSDFQTLLMSGISSGFAGVFGTPVAGMIFAIEVLTIGRMNYSAILPCLIAAIVSDRTCAAWGIGHTHYHIAAKITDPLTRQATSFDMQLLFYSATAGILFGLASLTFTGMTHLVSRWFKRTISRPVLRPVVGGLVVIGLTQVLGTRDYLGLGVSAPDESSVSIVNAFHADGAHPWSWLWKIVFTAITLGSGFKGGEVTPLFFVGATLGNTFANLTGVPVDLFAALGFVAVFAGATNTPLACTVMAVELFGGDYTLHFAIACLFSYLFSGHAGIYSSQRPGEPKPGKQTGRDSTADTLCSVKQ